MVGLEFSPSHFKWQSCLDKQFVGEAKQNSNHILVLTYSTPHELRMWPH